MRGEPWLSPTWLEQTHQAVPVLDELRDEHRRLLGELADARRARAEVVHRHAQEDQAMRAQALEAMRAGEAFDEHAAAVTPPLRRSVEVQVARERVGATLLAVCDFVERAMGVLDARADELAEVAALKQTRPVHDGQAQHDGDIAARLLARLQVPSNVLDEVAPVRAEAVRLAGDTAKAAA